MNKGFISIFILIAIISICTAQAEERSTFVLPDNLSKIEDEAFAGLSSVEVIVLPEGTLSIGSRAFADSSFNRITLPSSLTSIADNAFDGCSDFTVDVPENCYAYNWCAQHGLLEGLPASEDHFLYTIIDGYAYISSYTGPGGNIIVPQTLGGYPLGGLAAYAFYGCKSLTAISLPEGVTVLGDGAFLKCSSLQEITLPDSLCIIGTSCFDECYSLKEIFIPAAVTEIGMKNFAFQACTNLKEINVDENNVYYSSIDGVLYSKSATVIVTCPAGKKGDFTIPDNVQRIASYAFLSSSINNIILPNTITTIDKNAFVFCSNLESIYMPDSVTSIDEKAFNSTFGLTFICESNNYASEYAEKYRIAFEITDN